DLRGKVVGAVNSWCGDNCCPGKKYKDFLNFSHPIISSKFDQDCCSWLYGMNIFDLEASLPQNSAQKPDGRRKGAQAVA
ncbi:glycosyltransferase, partial [Klebsiella pneumoniae]